MFSARRFGAYPPPPPARRARVRWIGHHRGAVRTLLRERYISAAGRLSIDVQWPRFAYVQVSKSSAGGVGGDPDTIVLAADGSRRTILRTRAGRLVDSVRLSFPWLVWQERNTHREWDWDLVALNLQDRRRKVVARGRASGLGDKQFVPNVAIDGDVLVWDQRVRTRNGAANVIRAFDLARGRLWAVDGPGGGHMPDVWNGTVVWNEETARNVDGKVGVRSDLYVARLGERQRKVTGTGFAMFASLGNRLLAWLDLRREWLSQPPISNLYYSREGGPPVQVTESGLVDRALAGEDMLAWQDAAGKVYALDLRTNRAYVLAGLGKREAVLSDVEGRKVAYEVQPDVDRGGAAREMVMVELR